MLCYVMLVRCEVLSIVCSFESKFLPNLLLKMSCAGPKFQNYPFDPCAVFKTRALRWALHLLVNWLQRHMCVCDLVACSRNIDGTLEADIRTWGQGPGK